MKIIGFVFNYENREVLIRNILLKSKHEEDFSIRKD